MSEWTHLTKPLPPTTTLPPSVAALKAKRAAVVFASLKLQGVVDSGTTSTAIINGTTLRVGEGIGAVRLTAIGRDEVTVELAGESKVLSLPHGTNGPAPSANNLP